MSGEAQASTGAASLRAALAGGERHAARRLRHDLSDQPWVKRILDTAETLTRVSQRALLSPHGARPRI